MVNTGDKKIRHLLGAMLMSASTAMATLPAAASETPVRARCDDYSILAHAADQAVFKRHCGFQGEADRQALLKVLDRLNPACEARAAAQRGDFRLAALIGGGIPAPGQRRFWSVEGVNCGNLDDADVAMWLGMSDVFDNATHGQLQGRLRTFAAAYNAALLEQQGFPLPRNCKPMNGQKP
jgi:hypothetical protein